uniref:Uncharacterized protein n=1 Tax=Physcomitrium patens TaxID=3218 RepID=A0A7I4C7A6_PHYPA
MRIYEFMRGMGGYGEQMGTFVRGAPVWELHIERSGTRASRSFRTPKFKTGPLCNDPGQLRLSVSDAKQAVLSDARNDRHPLREQFSPEPLGRKTPKSKTPGRPSDRFITDRSAMDFNIANYMLAGLEENAVNNGSVHSPSK